MRKRFLNAWSCLNALATSYPSILGRPMSHRRTSGVNSLAFSRAVIGYGHLVVVSLQELFEAIGHIHIVIDYQDFSA